MSNWISTASGGRFYFANPTPDMVNIQDVATAEANLCRFTGQINEFYSVAEHSWHVSYLVPTKHARCALLHDGTEPYVNDLAKPLKRELPDYNAVEDLVWRLAVAPAFGLPQTMPQCIKDADLAMLKLEVSKLLPSHCLEELNLPGPIADRKLRLWSPKQARFFFLERYWELTKAA